MKNFPCHPQNQNTSFLEESQELMRLPPHQLTAEADHMVLFQQLALSTIASFYFFWPEVRPSVMRCILLFLGCFAIGSTSGFLKHSQKAGGIHLAEFEVWTGPFCPCAVFLMVPFSYHFTPI